MVDPEANFGNHPIHSTLDNINELLENLREDPPEDPLDVQILERFRRVNSHAKSLLESVDPHLTSEVTLNNAQAALQKEFNQLNSYLSNSNSSHLTNANAQVEQVLYHISSLHRIKGVSDVEGVRDAVTSFRMSAAQYMRYLETEYSEIAEKFENLVSKLNDLDSEVTGQKGRLDTAISTFQQQFSSAESTRSEQFLNAETNRSEQFNTSAESRRSEFSGLLEEAKGIKSSLADEGSKELDSVRDDLAAQAEGILNEINDFKADAERIAGVISITGMVEGYQRIANEEQRSARLFRRLAIASMVGLIVFAILAFSATVTEGFDFGSFGAKVFAAIAFGILAAYSARQADRHQTVERYNRRMELELATIGPYLTSLPEEQQHEIKRQLAERMFGNLPVLDLSKGSKTSGTSSDLLKLALESIQSLINK